MRTNRIGFSLEFGIILSEMRDQPVYSKEGIANYGGLVRFLVFGKDSPAFQLVKRLQSSIRILQIKKFTTTVSIMA